MHTHTEARRVQRILTATVMATALMSALSACGGGGGGKSAGLPGVNLASNPGGGDGGINLGGGTN
ncbi:hypothetical protein P3W54_09605, partial [Achromobacter anxifer]|nr:hypothetical protein [Achromobacter anxifer]